MRPARANPIFSLRCNIDVDPCALRTTKYMAFFYDVQPQFATAERPAYNAKPGYLGTDLTFSYINTLTERWEFVAGTRISLNQGASNKNSPLYTKDYGIGVYAAFTWKFWESKTRAAN